MNLKDSSARFLVKIRVSADLLTWLGLFLSFLCAFYIISGHAMWAGIALLFSGLCDLMDGAVARASGKAGVFGGILDSSLDRYGDGIVLGTIVLHTAWHHILVYAVPALFALLGSFAISYIRARAECDLEDCRVGFWERGERLVFLSLGLITHNMATVLILLAVGVQWTAWQRLSRASRSAKGLPAGKAKAGRNSWPYYLKVAALVLAVFFFRR